MTAGVDDEEQLKIVRNALIDTIHSLPQEIPVGSIMLGLIQITAVSVTAPCDELQDVVQWALDQFISACRQLAHEGLEFKINDPKPKTEH